VQAVLVTVTDKHIPFGEDVRKRLLAAGIRVEGDFRNEKLGYKIREAQMQKTPFMLVIGDREVASCQISPRQRDGQNLGSIGVDAFIDLVREQCAQFK
jgi:threonyl-tRNA synthetase